MIWLWSPGHETTFNHWTFISNGNTRFNWAVDFLLPDFLNKSVKDLNYVGTFCAEWIALPFSLIAIALVSAKIMIAPKYNSRVYLLRITLITTIFPAPAFPITKVHLEKIITVFCTVFKVCGILLELTSIVHRG